MSLEKYNQKRDFEQTNEPKGKTVQSDKELIFVVQKHAASHLHYDFRLELDGVLKSWAVPKGPSMNPEDKRLAIMVEDHPYSYKDFEGSIPKGNYGAGTVIVWDNGTYQPADTAKNPQKELLSALNKGKISFNLKGKKLQGEFSLVKLKGKQENAWLLIKKQDQYATEKDILTENKSVISNITLESLDKKKHQKGGKNATDKKNDVNFVSPMLAGKNKKPFDSSDYIFENKYDGYRTISVINDKKVELWSRNKNSFTTQFQLIANELQKIKHLAVLDGEIVVEDKNGRAGFQLLQNYIKTGEGKLKYYVFDLLNLDGNDTTSLSLLERKELLKILLEKYKLESIIYAPYIVAKGKNLYEEAIKENSEGIIAKRIDGNYLTGKRSDDWLKIKITNQEEAIIIGITEPKNSRNYFGALLLAQYKDNQLEYVGKCGSGFTEDTLKELYSQLKPTFISKSPVSKKVALRDTIQWVKPKMVCQVKYTEWTRDGHLRHPVYLGIRMDKKPNDVIFQGENSTNNNEEEEEEDISIIENNYDLTIGKITLHLTNQNKIYFPESSITKGDIVNYYSAVADLILPYLKNRPQSMNRFPNGITGSSFYQKDIEIEKVPNWLKTFPIHSESNQKELNYLLCNDKATLLYMANLGCIDFNPWNSTIKKLENPDWMVIDIDPEKEDFKAVVQVALKVKEVMDELDTECYCKTSGASGLHVYIPLKAKYNYETVKIFAELVAREVQQQLPETTTLERSIKKRNHKIYIDYLQNRKGQTLAAPYSIRPKIGATVSTPLEWDEVNEDLHPSQFTIKNALERFTKKGDLWSPVLKSGTNINAILKKLESKK
ncbi:DNA ligase D [Flavobacterium sp.]|uniref:DNA ligase D n=1 Tax=Flavobacterium sp. TaxID=239 RepID=UPI003C502D20